MEFNTKPMKMGDCTALQKSQKPKQIMIIKHVILLLNMLETNRWHTWIELLKYINLHRIIQMSYVLEGRVYVLIYKYPVKTGLAH